MIHKLFLSLAALALTVPTAFAQDSRPAPLAVAGQEKTPEKPAPGGALASAQATEKQVLSAERPAYPLATCPISGQKLGSDAIDKVVGGHLVRVCCPKCVAAVEKDPAAIRQKIVEAVIQQQKPAYPLTTCPVTGEKLGADAVDHVVGTRLVRLKDKATIAVFEKGPADALAKVDKALIEAQLAKYAATACPVTGEALGKDAHNMLYGTRLVRLCCSGCVKKFNATPEKYLAELDKQK